MKSKSNKMTPQQWRLYDHLKTLMENEDNRATTIAEIVNAFPEVYELKITEGNKSNCPKLYEDLKAITMSYEVDLIVTLNHNRIRLGTELDVLKRLNSLIMRTRWEEAEIRTIKNKIKQNMQFKLLTNAGVPIDNSPNAKAWHVAFSDSNIALTIKELEEEIKEKNRAKAQTQQPSADNSQEC